MHFGPPDFSERKVEIKEDPLFQGPLGEVVNRFIETWILFKKDYLGYRNRIRANLRIFSALYTALIFYVASFIFVSISVIFFLRVELIDIAPFNSRDFVSIIATFVGLWLGLAWNERIRIHKKWDYLAGLYNKVTAMSPSDKNGEKCKKLLEISLALDILKLEMWAHDSFKDVFLDQLEDAMRYTIVPRSAVEFNIDSLYSRGIYRTRAKNYLTNYLFMVRSDDETLLIENNTWIEKSA